MSLRTHLAGSLLCSLWAGAVLAGPVTQPAPKSVLDGVAGLERPISLAEPRIALDDLLKRISKETGVALYADRTAADEPAAVVVSEMPASRLLNELAAFFDYRWAREQGSSGPRFRLHQDLKQKAEEEALRAAAWADEERRLRIVLGAYVKVGQLSEQEYAAQREALEQRPSGGPRPSVEEDRVYRGLRECGSSAKRSLARLLGQLTPSDWQALWRGERLRLYSKPEAGERGLPPDISRTLAGFRPSASWDNQRAVARAQQREPDFATALRQGHEAQDRSWETADGVRVVIRLHRGFEMGQRFARDRSATSLTAVALPLLKPDPGGSVRHVAPEQVRVWIWAANTQPKWGYDPPERLAALEKDPVFSVARPFSPKPPVPQHDGRPGYGPIPHLLPEMAGAYGVSFLADSYFPTPRVGSLGSGGPISLGALLTRLSGRYESDINRITYNYYRWDRDESLVRLRDRTWFFDRPKEIPARLLTRWSRLCEERGCLPLEEYAAGIASLTDSQWDSLGENDYSAVLTPASQWIPTDETDRLLLRLYRSLNSAQRARLTRGAAISWAELNAPQRELLLSAVENQSLSSSTPITRADLAATSVVLAMEPADLIRRKQGPVLRDQPVEPGLDRAQYPRFFGDDPAPGPEMEGAGDQPPALPITYTRFPAAWVTFVVRCGRSHLPATRMLVSRAR